jgi:subtilase family serine protease
MESFMRSWKFLLPLLASTLCFAQQPDRITGPIDSSQMVTLPGHVNRHASPQYDQGPVEPSRQLGYVTLIMAPSPGQQAALDQLLALQQDRSSPDYHKWLTPAQYANRFGLSQNDVNKITGWLKSQGFEIVSIARGRNSVVFSGTVAQIEIAFKTEIHRYEVNGEKHIANSTLPAVPAALSGIVTGVRGLTDFLPKPTYVRPLHYGNIPGPHPSYTATISESTYYFLGPGDIGTIYDTNPLYGASPSIDGAGQKLAIIGQTDIYLADIADFRTGFGLNPITGCTTNASGVVTACNSTYFQYVLPTGTTDLGTPSTCGDLGEADLDIEWSGATAQNAQIIFVNSPVTFSSDCTEVLSGGGVDTALTYAIDNATAPVISMSYGICEAETDSLETVLMQGNAEGITILNSAGDVGSAACDYSSTSANPPFAAAVNGLAVSYPASSPEVTGVGGTSIPPIPAADYSPTYWGSTNGTTGGSALPTLEALEAPWNDDVAFAQFCADNAGNPFCTHGGSPSVTGWVPITSAETAQEDVWIDAGGGGVSNCFNETGAGVCTSGFPKPAWQAVTIPGLTSPQDTYRFVPDVSLLASPNYPGYILCTPQAGSTTSTCSPGGAAGITNAVDAFSLVGGTSASTPIFAGIVTLLNQYLGGTSSSGLGNINSMLYTLAASTPDAFHPIKSGDNDVYCQKNTPSGQPPDVICPTAGVFGFSASNFDTTTGYNLVTGLGSVDANNLAIAWAASRTASATAISSPTTNAYQGTSVTFTATVTPSTATGNVSFYNNGSTTALGTATLSLGTAAFATTSLPAGTDSVTATYNGSGSNDVSTSAPPAVVTVTVPFTMSASPSSFSVAAGQTATSTITITPVNGFTGAVSFTNSTASSPGSCTVGLPAGALCSFNPGSVTLDGNPLHPMNVVLTTTTAANMALPAGAQAITVTGTSGTATGTAQVSLTATATNQTLILTPKASTYPVSVGGTAAVLITVTGTGSPISFVTNSTTALPLTYSCAGTPSLSTSEISCQLPSNGQPTSLNAVTVSLVTTPVTTSQLRPLGGSRIFYALLLPGLFGIVFAVGSRGRGLRLLSLMVVLGFSTLWLGACGGNNGSSGQQNPGTPAGNYAVTINATTGGPNPVTSSFKITLTVTAQ